ncbi:uncharacterized protein FYW61_008857 isoform 2-T2 [Anableps anableps]
MKLYLQSVCLPEMTLRCILVCFSLTCCLVTGQPEPEYVLHGQTAIFYTDITEQPDNILWKHDGNKVVEFDGSEESSFGSFERRVDLDYYSADLKIHNVRYEDSGLYDLEAFIKHNLYPKNYQLKVIDKVAKPTISCEMHHASTPDEPGGQATLQCSSPSRNQSLLTFQWRSNSKMSLGPVLVISLGGEHDNYMFNCTVSNPLTQESAVFIAKDCYLETKSEAGLIAGVVIAVAVLLLIAACIIYLWYKKGYSKHEKSSDMENQLNHRVTQGEIEEIQSLLGRIPTFPSKQTLGHLVQRNDAQFDPSPKDSEENKIQDSEIPAPSPAPNKPPRTFSDRHAKENGRGNEAEPKDDVEEKVLEGDPSDSERMNAELTAVSSEHSPERNKDDRASCPPEVPQKSKLVRNFSALQKVTDENTHPKVTKKQGLNDPADAGNPNEVSDNQSPEKNKNEDDKASSPPEVPRKSNLVRNFSALQKASDENAHPRVKKQVLDDPEESGNPKELSDNQNSEKKKEENESAKPTSKNDVHPPPVAKENSPLSQSSPKISPKDEHKQDISSDELAGEPAKKSTGGSASMSSEESENEEQGPPATTPEKTDPKLAVVEQKSD